LLRVGKTTWLFMLAATHDGAEAFAERLANGHRDLGRNRPRGPLPDYALSVEHTWFHRDQRPQLLDAFERLLANEPCRTTTVAAWSALPSYSQGLTSWQ
jgi:hypothetical protein